MDAFLGFPSNVGSYVRWKILWSSKRGQLSRSEYRQDMCLKSGKGQQPEQETQIPTHLSIKDVFCRYEVSLNLGTDAKTYCQEKYSRHHRTVDRGIL